MGVRSRTTPSTQLVRSQSVVVFFSECRVLAHIHTRTYLVHIYMQMCKVVGA
jgi:hypothetical protein